jgi:hypothetical protein
MMTLAGYTAMNPEERLVMGYIWKTAEYPWLNVWHQPNDGQAIRTRVWNSAPPASASLTSCCSKTMSPFLGATHLNTSMPAKPLKNRGFVSWLLSLKASVRW